ncbi:MAG TPA: threonine synthase [Candidatus Limnocylindrales bacterium]|nr:threonine synthase [Candidatus Limnocylindrales bacterium]
MTSFATHLECSRCAQDFEINTLQQTCPKEGGPLLVRYDLRRVHEVVQRDALASRPHTLWRYRELLPVEDDAVVTLGENNTPLLDAPRLGKHLGIAALLIKDEGQLPTGSFKARGAAVGVTRAKELGVRTLALPTAGNAGAAWAAYGARAGLHVVVVMPDTTPQVIQRETAAYGADVWLVPGSIADAGAVVKKTCAERGWYDASTLKEPYRIEGKKTMGFELAEQLDWTLPDVIVYPTGGGVGLIGMWKAFAELREIGWLHDGKTRFVAAQATGCAPIVRAFEDGADESQMWPDPQTFAAGIRVPKALGDFLVLRALRETGGIAIAVTEEEIAAHMASAGEHEGMLVCPEGGAALAAASRLRRDGWIRDGERVAVFNTGSGLKYSESLQGRAPRALPAGSLPS